MNKLTKAKPWNRINVPVYSISSRLGDKANMNIITYVTAVSMQPKRYTCCIYHNTQTLSYAGTSGEFVLQLLNAEQYRLVPLLGKKSGNVTDKIKRLQRRKELTLWNNYPILKNCLAVLLLKTVEIVDCGDHTAFICDVADYKNLNNGHPLTLDILRLHKLVRI
jgi:flavin reductase (DIM6/NTAB) family NADH-FMN oxidoreductase RutF